MSWDVKMRKLPQERRLYELRQTVFYPWAIYQSSALRSRNIADISPILTRWNLGHSRLPAIFRKWPFWFSWSLFCGCTLWGRSVESGHPEDSAADGLGSCRWQLQLLRNTHQMCACALASFWVCSYRPFEQQRPPRLPRPSEHPQAIA